DGERVWVVDIVDDHARYLLAAHACEALSGEAVWACFVTASAAYGLPRQLLSDHGTYFTGRLHGVEVALYRHHADDGRELARAARRAPARRARPTRLPQARGRAQGRPARRRRLRRTDPRPRPTLGRRPRPHRRRRPADPHLPRRTARALALARPQPHLPESRH